MDVLRIIFLGAYLFINHKITTTAISDQLDLLTAFNPGKAAQFCAFKSILTCSAFVRHSTLAYDSAYEPYSAFAAPKLGTARDIHSGTTRSNRPDHALASLHALNNSSQSWNHKQLLSCLTTTNNSDLS
ncbi:hypothetical protein F511_34497 [Dorcoceras hygrometricum]|uniref:Uncharacterized protein n=1 Tax=Dorcoceras hygrometricum TaxID=472368 RepID=A0A2Z7A058_9LAMI|nr:hypothetical protein F511_34497 [Dorcoceras hygrometricum]